MTLQPTFVDPILPALRFRSRHVQETIASYLKQYLAQLGWVDAPVNFGTTPVTFMLFPPEDERATKGEIPPNRIAITLGNEPDELEEQLGGGLYSVAYPLFVDIYGEHFSISRSIGNDVKDLLTRKAIDLFDWTLADETHAPVQVPGAWIEFNNVAGPRMPAGATTAEGFRRYWRVVQAVALTTFSDVLPGNLVELDGESHGVAAVSASLGVTRTPIGMSAASAGVATIAADLSVAAGGGGGGDLPLSSNPPSDHHLDAPVIDTLTGTKTFDLSAYTPNAVDLTDDGSPWDDFHTSSPVARAPKSAWIKYVCTVSGTATFSTIGSGYDTFLRVLDDTGTEVGFDDDGGNSHGGSSGESWVQVAVTAGTTYYIRPSPFPSSTNGSGTLGQQAATVFNWSVPG